MEINTEIQTRLKSFIKEIKIMRPEILSFFNEDVSKYLKFLNDFDEKINKAGLNNLDLQEEINKETFQIVKKGYGIEKIVDIKIAEEAKRLFRNLIIQWMGQSKIMKRALEKPRGYPGDYQMVELMYDNKPVSEGIGYYFDKGFLESELTIAVKNRKNKMIKLLEQFIEASDATRINILNLACGSCREIKELKDFSGKEIKFTCIDMDREALDFASKSLSGLNANFVEHDIIDIVRKQEKEMLRDYNLIYSIGLIDYLPDRILKKLIKMCYEGLEKNGRLIVSHKDRGIYIPIREDWLTDWRFVPRSEKEVVKLAVESGVPELSIEIEREPSQIIFFLSILKK